MAKKSAQKKASAKKPVAVKAPVAETAPEIAPETETAETAPLASVPNADESVQPETTEDSSIGEKNGAGDASEESEAPAPVAETAKAPEKAPKKKEQTEPRDMLVQVLETRQTAVIRKSEYDSNKHVAL